MKYLSNYDLIKLVSILKLYSLISDDYKLNRFNEVETINDLRNKLLDSIEINEKIKCLCNVCIYELIKLSYK